MTKSDYQKLQSALARFMQTQDKKMQEEMKKLLLKHAKEAALTGDFKTAEYVAGVKFIYDSYRVKGADAATKIADKALEELLANPVLRDTPIVHTLKKQTFAGAGKTVFVENPATGKIDAVPESMYATYISRFNLSGNTANRPMHVWDIDSLIDKAAQEKQEAILNVVHQGLADGVDVKDIAHDLEGHINGTRKMGRWGSLRPDEEFEAAVQKLIDERGYTPEGARSMVGKEWKAAGKERLPGSREYYQRFGSAGADYRCIRLIRTEASVQLNTRQAEIARTNPAVDNGKAEIILEQNRDSYNCECQMNAKATKGGKYMGIDGYFYNDEELKDRVVNENGNSVSIPPYH